MLRNRWRVAAASAAAVGSTAYLYYVFVRRPSETFSLMVPVTGPDGKRTRELRRFTRLSAEETERRITTLATSSTVPQPSGIVWKYATAQLPSNNPIEDTHASAVFGRNDLHGISGSGSDGDYLFFAVLDGHSGTNTSRLLSKTLIPAVALQLNELSKPPSTYLPRSQQQSSWLDYFHSLLSGKPQIRFDSDPKYVSAAIRAAFAMIDSDIVNAPLRLIAEHRKQSKSGDDPPDLSGHPMALATILPALSGSCALLAMLDIAHRDLYVACTGDCRAVAGVWEEGPDGTGRWRADVLTEDQTGDNLNEIERMRSEHPTEEKETVIQRGRVLGGLQPSRAFGDARYKWPSHIQDLLLRVFLDGNNLPLRRPRDFKTPPYVTADPVVTHRKLDFLPLPDSPPPTPFPALPRPSAISTAAPSVSSEANASPRSATTRFLILGTDGLWDELSAREAVSLVAAHLSGLRTASIFRSDLDSMVPTYIGSAGIGKERVVAEQAKQNEDKRGHPWAFVDENPSTHLVRNAFGGADKKGLNRLLSIPAPWSRPHRDDITVTVVWWEDGRANNVKIEKVHIPPTSKGFFASDSSPLGTETEKVKPKL